MHRLATSFILGFHGCDRRVAERLLAGDPFMPSENNYDWLGHGIYFWEANPERGLEFARTASRRTGARIEDPAVIGAVIDLGACLDLTTSEGNAQVRTAYPVLCAMAAADGNPLPVNNTDGLRRNLDCAVVNTLHRILDQTGKPPIDTVRGIFVEGPPLYPGSGFHKKTHVQICVRALSCIKGVFRVPPAP